MPAQYHIRLRDTSGAYVAWLDQAGAFWQLQVGHTLNGRGMFRLSLSDEDERAVLFTLDSIVEVWRSHDEFGLDWYREFVGLTRATVREHDASDIRRLTAYGHGLNDLLRRRVVAYRAGDAKTQKSGPADNVMKAYVLENAGSLATTGNGRVVAGVIAGLSVQADASAAPTWDGARAWSNLLEVLQAISDQAAVDFEIVHTTGASFDFRTYYPRKGTDRSKVGLNPMTGLNGAGQVPVVFEIANSTMREPTLTFDRRDETNRVMALGEGEEQNREVQVADEASLQDDSPWNVSESAVNVSQQSMDSAALLDSAEQELQAQRPRNSLVFRVVQQAEQFYGKHYFLGDKVTARFAEAEKHYDVIGVAANYAPGVAAGEEVEMELQEA